MKARSLRSVSLLCVSGAVALLCGFVMMLFLRPLSASSGSLGTEAINTAYGGSSLASCDPPPTIVVTSTEYYGPGTLRRALWLAQACFGTKIIFSSDVFPPGAPTTIVITEALQLKADGAIVDASNAGVILDGSQAGPSENGFELWSDECVVQGLTIRGFPGSGIYIVEGADGNTIGGSRAVGAGPNGEGNLIVLNGMDGIKIHGDGTLVQGNTIGIDPKDLEDWGNDASGITLTGGVTETIIGSTEVGRRNVISGNGRYGIQISGSGTPGNRVIGNYVGTGIDGVSSKGNGSAGILLGNGAQNNRIGDTTTGAGNTIAFNAEDGILAVSCGGNTIARNSIHSNGGVGIRDVSHCLDAPVLTATDVGTDEAVTGSTLPGAWVEIFADDADEGRFYEGSTTADDHGSFSFTKTGGFRASNVTATATDIAGNTSAFSRPAHLAWTVLLYLNGDNDLQDAIFDTFDNLVAAGPSPYANVLALVDGYTDTVRSGTTLYDITSGRPISLSAPVTLTGELDMGDRQTLVDFVTWGHAYAPARHTLLAIVDHGGGWAPTSCGGDRAPVLASIKHDYLGGNSGLSWDFSSSYDYLDSGKMQRALATITGNGAAPLDVVFFDVCLMGMVEVAYQIQDYARFFVSSQNLGWTPVGADGRYVRAVQGIGPSTTPRQMAELLVDIVCRSDAYGRASIYRVGGGLGHTAGDRASSGRLWYGHQPDADDPWPGLNPPSKRTSKRRSWTTMPIFRSSRKRMAFVDLYDFAGHAAQRFADPGVITAAEALTTSLGPRLWQSGTPAAAPG